MTWGNNGAGPLGVPPIGQPASVNSPMVGQQGQAYPPFYNNSFESVLAAVSRGEISLNMLISAGSGGNQYSGNGSISAGLSLGNPTLLQAMSQGPVAQNATNGIGVVSGPGVGAGNGPGIAAVVSGNGGVNGVPYNGNNTGHTTSFGGTQAIDAKQMVTVAVFANPIQYGGN